MSPLLLCHHVNGVAAATVAQALNPPGTRTAIGADNGTQIFNGIIDDVRIYNRTLGADEIRQLYTAGR